MRGGSAFPDEREEDSDMDTSSETKRQTSETIVMRGKCTYLQTSQGISGSRPAPLRPLQFAHGTDKPVTMSDTRTKLVDGATWQTQEAILLVQVIQLQLCSSAEKANS